MISRFVSFASILASVYLVYRYRYRIMGSLLELKWLRKSMVGFVMRLPFVKQKVMDDLLFSPKPSNT